MKKQLLKIFMLSIVIIAIFCTKSYCVESGTVRMQIIPGGTVWTNINVSESYEECQSLNSSTSTLGTSLLKAHLTTDADWSAMAIFSVSQYGGATTNSPEKTNGNNSGIYNVGKWKVQTTGILETANANSTIYISNLFNEDGTVKNYVRQWPGTRTDTGFVGFTDTYGWLGSWTYWGSNTSWPISIRNGLFGVCVGNGDIGVASGGPFSDVTFRPVIWN